MSNKTQLAVPGNYMYLASHIQANKFRNQLNSDSSILECPISLQNIPAFEEDSITTKVGGIPSWLKPSFEDDFTIPSPPNCTSCNTQLMLLCQVFAPIDFPTDSCDLPAPSNNASHLGNRTRHARTVYVFGCNNPRCGNAPGTWVAMSLCQSEGFEVSASEQGNVNTISHDDDFDGDISSDDDDQDDLINAFSGMSLNPQLNEPKVSNKPTSTSTSTPKTTSVAQNVSAPKSKFEGLTKSKGTTVKGAGMFDMGGWSDSDSDSEDENGDGDIADDLNTDEGEGIVGDNIILEETDMFSHLTQLLDKRDQDNVERETKLQQLREEAEVERQHQLELQQQEALLKAAELKHKMVVVSDKEKTFKIFKPFYLHWIFEPNAVKEDYSREEALLQEYYSREKEETETNNKKGGSDDVNAEDDEYEASGDKVLRRFMSRVDRQPDQCLRYCPTKPLILHEIPNTSETKKLREMAKNHPLDSFKHISGLWGIHDVPECECGAPMKLEFQIMPNLLNELKVNENEFDLRRSSTLSNGMDWGMIDVYTCPMMCSPDEYANGFCHVHPSI